MKKKISLKAQLIIMITCFIGVCLLVLSFFQLFLLDDVYKNNKINNIKEIEKDIRKELVKGDLDEYLSSLSLEENITIRIISSRFDIYHGNNDFSFSLNKLNGRDIDILANEINSSKDKKKLIETTIDKAKNDQVFIYGEVLDYNNTKTLILVSTLVAPLTATKNTIAFEYIFIAIILVLAGIIFALFLSKIILNPIRNINNAAKNLPQGKYNNVDCPQFELDELNNTLQNANTQINKAETAKKELLANVSHDLKTPLTMISGYAEMIKDLKGGNKKEYADIIIDESKRISILVDDLVDLSLLEDNKLTLNKEDISINDLLNDVFNQYKSICKKNKISFDINIEVDSIVNIDVARIKQVLYNFINNAINYNDKKIKKIELGVLKKDNSYMIYVLDNGKGIEDKDINNIWDRYYKVDKTHKRASIGSGIGLAISKKILEAHNLEYGVESKVDEYSKFYFIIK